MERQKPVIDPVLDFDLASGRVSHDWIEVLSKDVETLNLELCYVLETHVHADHLSASDVKKKYPKVKIGISQRIIEVQKTFAEIYSMQKDIKGDGSEFDLLLSHGDVISLSREIKALSTPGHTPLV